MPTTGHDAIDFNELATYGLDFSTENNSQSVTMGAMIDQEDEEQFVRSILGWSQIEAGPPQKIDRKVPYQHPRYTWMWASAVRFREFTKNLGKNTGPGGSHEADKAAYEITFAPRPYKISDSLEPPANPMAWYVVKQELFAIESARTESDKPMFKWADVPAELIRDAPPAIPEPHGDLAYTFIQIPAVPDADGYPRLPAELRDNIIATVGKINDDTFDDTFPKHSLLCLAPEITAPYVMANGAWAFDIKYLFSLRGYVDVSADLDDGKPTPNWNRILKPKKARAERYVGVWLNEPGNTPPYEEADFDLLFSVA